MSGTAERLDLDEAEAYGRAFADVYDTWYHEVTDAEATARFVARHHPGGPVLELGVGTGRLARPLAARGLTVVGVDASADMLTACPTGVGPGAVHRVRSDFRALPFGRRPSRPAPFGTALIAFNTLFNLAREHEQLTLLHELARLVRPEGTIVVEAADVTPLLDGPTRAVGRRSGSADQVVITATQLDRATQRVSGQHVEIDDDGVRLRPWVLRWVTPDQLDDLARRAGLVPVARYGSWDEAPFDDGADTHVSVYRPAP